MSQLVITVNKTITQNHEIKYIQLTHKNTS